jgi:hypothetical protein
MCAIENNYPLRTYCEIVQSCILGVFGSISAKGGDPHAHFEDKRSHNGEINIAGGQLFPCQGRVDRFLLSLVIISSINQVQLDLE